MVATIGEDGRVEEPATIPTTESSLRRWSILREMSGTSEKTFYLETFGCQMNQADTEIVVSLLRADGFVLAADEAEADVMLLNSCAVRENAEQRVIGRLTDLRRHMTRDTVLGVTGCMAQRLGPRLLDADSRVILQAYADGINAYLKDHSGTAVSLEYAVLKLLAPKYAIEPWTPVNTLTWAKRQGALVGPAHSVCIASRPP